MGELRALALSALLLVAATGAAQAEPSYLCTAEQSATLHFDRQVRAWAPQAAFVSGDRFLLCRVNDDECNTWHSDARWGFFKFGETLPMALCDTDLNCDSVEFDNNNELSLTWHWYRDNPNDSDGFSNKQSPALLLSPMPVAERVQRFAYRRAAAHAQTLPQPLKA